ncbi:MAG: ribose 5-phosphate isomerase B [Candidatus Omnitrophica bacterium]|nr:ribose 5-phosphate isomerase B [Candidatus Omnitrophota bacterium]MBD3269299.1 ribose 5-phosphate isomerase B [Candidatus Omnitrophota bacterium]
MRIGLASDHRGFNLKHSLINYLEEKNHKVIDFGTFSKDPCDYPDYTYLAASAVRNKECDRAVIICYTGIGSCIAANKVRGVRAALVYSLKSAVFTRRHNNSNVLVLPSHLFKADYAKRIVSRWLKEEFEGGRHLRRIKKIRDIEDKESI